MPEIVDHENGIYVDRLKIIYQSIAQPGADPVATVVLIVDAGTALNRDELRSQLERLHWTRGADGQPEHQPFVSSDRYDHASWGASGGQLEIVIQAAQLAVGGIVGGMAGTR
jgi:hypothetical protein